jgi:hypothetical protein
VPINNIPVPAVLSHYGCAGGESESRASACGASVSVLDVHRVLPFPCLTGRERETDSKVTSHAPQLLGERDQGRSQKTIRALDPSPAHAYPMHAGPVMPQGTEETSKSTTDPARAA